MLKQPQAIRTTAKAIIISQGFWYLLPGGGQEHGETLAQALRRECLEELPSRWK